MISILYGCGAGVNSGKDSEGVITYNITYPKPLPGYISKFMPSDMEMHFKGNRYLTNLSFSMGMIKMFYLIDNNKQEMTEMIKLMSNKYATTSTETEVKELMKKLPKHEIKVIEGETKMIAGYNCKKAIATILGQDETFTIYYTDDIGLTKPNWCTPFSGIDGVLMEYQIDRFDVVMRFTAEKVEFIEQDETNFTVPAQFKVVPQNEMNKVYTMFEELND